MGCVTSNQDDILVSRELNEDKTEDDKIMKLLFLGSGGSGKSTFFKQLKTVHGDGFEETDKQQFKEYIQAQIIEQMKQLILGIETLKETKSEKYGHLKISEGADDAIQYIQDLPNGSVVDEDVAKAVQILWKEEAIKAAFEERGILKVEDSSEYFFNEVQRIAQADYSPNTAVCLYKTIKKKKKDILRVRHRTTGVVEQRLFIHGTKFQIFDVGGQRSERKKWIHCFEYVQAVIFVASLAAYNEVMYEDEQCNSMIDSLDLFDEICNSQWLQNTAMILFLNKQDEFAKRIQRIPLKVCFPEYEGENTYEPCLEYIKSQYNIKNKSDKRQIYCHVTVATDQNNVERVFGDVQHIVIGISLVNGISTCSTIFFLFNFFTCF
ncbi:trimeric G-protein alpha o subunit [Reticulomyxa filosa]|uniref:Trimeric G-protein alpha o subunit n=1 Tax=Reticulomyxa filosa TaxID=46433 RepID=X6MFQ9_RETFI|nr:trimeric G-protein alpha o subunit [Reticulomyxa filosa]|eukprot:ETO12496.1 trimeric G-protein alpha o subunit [Reticulomyxa filosa]